jgi:hypothetical protein
LQADLKDFAESTPIRSGTSELSGSGVAGTVLASASGLSEEKGVFKPIVES